MEGLTNDSSKGNNIYLTIFGGELHLPQKEAGEGVLSRVNKNNVEVFYKKFTGVDGMITNVSITDEKFGKELHITVQKGKNKFVVQTGANGGYAFGFLSRIPNIDFSKPVLLKPFDIEDEKDGKVRSYFVTYQGAELNEKVASYFTKDEPSGLPDLKQIEVNGQKVWDASERIAFFEKMIYDEGGIASKLAEMYAEKTATDELMEGDPNASNYDNAMANAEKGGAEATAKKKADEKAEKKANKKKAPAKKQANA